MASTKKYPRWPAIVAILGEEGLRRYAEEIYERVEAISTASIEEVKVEVSWVEGGPTSGGWPTTALGQGWEDGYQTVTITVRGRELQAGLECPYELDRTGEERQALLRLNRRVSLVPEIFRCAYAYWKRELEEIGRRLGEDLPVPPLPDLLPCEAGWEEWRKTTQALVAEVRELVEVLPPYAARLDYPREQLLRILEGDLKVTEFEGCGGTYPAGLTIWLPETQQVVRERIAQGRAALEQIKGEVRARRAAADLEEQLVNETTCPLCSQKLQGGICPAYPRELGGKLRQGHTPDGRDEYGDDVKLQDVIVDGKIVAEVWECGFRSRHADDGPGSGDVYLRLVTERGYKVPW